MADRKNRQIYQAGELDKTRKNLGNIDPEEAKRMAALLGGDVGLEKDAPAIIQGYEKISGYSRRRSDSSRRSPGSGHRKKTGTGNDLGEKSPSVSEEYGRGGENTGKDKSSPLVIESKPKSGAVRKARGNYWVRIRTNFLAAKREHSIKTLASAMSSIFTFIQDRDELNPRFIRNARRDLLEPAGKIQSGAAELLAAGSKRNMTYRADPFYRAVLETLASWDIRTMENELSLLEKNSRGLQVESTARLCRALFTPIVKLQNLEQEIHITNSIRHFYELIIKTGKGGDPGKLGKFKNISLELMGLYPVLQKRIHYGCYPLLMKLSCSSYSEYVEFYSTCAGEYMGFLFLETEDLLMLPVEMPPVSPEENSLTQTEWEPSRKQEEKIPGEFTEGLRFLQEMFPQSGFEDLSDFPDLCPYFQPLFDLPRNFELLPPEDPLQGITVIIAFMKELFFAFGGVEFTSLKNDEWDLPEIRSTFEEYTSSWYEYIESFLPRQILAPLLEYCRGIEKNSDFCKSDYGEKLEAKIFWLKKMYCLPHLKAGRKVRGKSPASGKGVRLYHLTEDLFSLFSAVLNNDNRDPGVRNMDDPILFEVPTEVSGRFMATIEKRGMKGTNRDLITISASIICLLNELLNKPSSFYYRKPPYPIFRTDGAGRENPVYSVTPLETLKIIKDWDKRIKKGSCTEEDLEIRPCCREELEIIIAGLLREKTDVVLLKLKISSPVPENPMEPILENTLRLGPDRWYRISGEEWLVTLTETPPEGSVRLTNRLLNQLVPLYKPGIRIYAGLTPLSAEWTPDRALYIASNTLKEAEKRRGEVVVMYNPEEKKYRLYTIKSRKKAEDNKDESIS